MTILEGYPTPPLARDNANRTGRPVRDCFDETQYPHGKPTMYTVTCTTDELGGRAMGDDFDLGEFDTLQEASQFVMASVIDGVRGTGCFSIRGAAGELHYVETDGSVYTL